MWRVFWWVAAKPDCFSPARCSAQGLCVALGASIPASEDCFLCRATATLYHYLCAWPLPYCVTGSKLRVSFTCGIRMSFVCCSLRSGIHRPFAFPLTEGSRGLSLRSFWEHSTVIRTLAEISFVAVHVSLKTGTNTVMVFPYQISSQDVTQAGLEPMTLLPQSPEGWDSRSVTPCSADWCFPNTL